MERMAGHYATMQQMTQLDEQQRSLEEQNPGFVVSQIQHEDFQITRFQRQMEQSRMGAVDQAAQKKARYHLEIQVMEVLKLLDFEGDALRIDEQSFGGLADALLCLGVHRDDVDYLGDALAERDLRKAAISRIQQEMAFFITNAQMSDENKKILENLDHSMILDIARSKMDPDFQIHTLVHKVQRLELNYRFELDRLFSVSDLSVQKRNKIVDLVNQRDFDALKVVLRIY